MSGLCGVRPCDWPSSWLELLGPDAGDPKANREAPSPFSFYVLLGRGQIDEAKAALMPLLNPKSGVATALRGPILLESAYFHAFHLGEIEEARKALATAQSRFPCKTFELGSPERAMAAIALAEGDAAGARSLIDTGLAKARKALKSRPTGWAKMECDLLEQMLLSPALSTGPALAGVPAPLGA